MTIRVQLFARLRDLVGVDFLSVVLPGEATIEALKTKLALQHPSAASLLEKSAIAINHQYAAAGTALSNGDEVAVIPPVSGG